MLWKETFWKTSIGAGKLKLALKKSTINVNGNESLVGKVQRAGFCDGVDETSNFTMKGNVFINE
jgi:hypothetical protein